MNYLKKKGHCERSKNEHMTAPYKNSRLKI